LLNLVIAIKIKNTFKLIYAEKNITTYLYEKICDLCKVETCSYSKSIVVYVFEHTSQGHNLGSGPVKSTVSTLYNKINFSH
jgi:hypothetical protein